MLSTRLMSRCRCTKCRDRRYLHDGICLESCPAGFNEVGTGNFKRRCVQRQSRCPLLQHCNACTEDVYVGRRLFDVRAIWWCTVHASIIVGPTFWWVHVCWSGQTDVRSVQVSGICITACAWTLAQRGTTMPGPEISIVVATFTPVYLAQTRSTRAISAMHNDLRTVACTVCVLCMDSARGALVLMVCEYCLDVVHCIHRCIQCREMHYLHEGSCVASCPIGTDPIGTGKFNRECHRSS